MQDDGTGFVKENPTVHVEHDGEREKINNLLILVDPIIKEGIEIASNENPPTVEKLKDLNDVFHSMILSPESFSCQIESPKERIDKNGNQREIFGFKVEGEGDYLVGVRFEEYANHEQIKVRLQDLIGETKEKIKGIRYSAGSSSTSQERAEHLLTTAKGMDELVKSLGMRWLRKIDITLNSVEEGLPIAGIMIADCCDGLGITPKDFTDSNVLRGNKYGFLYTVPRPSGLSIDYENLKQLLINYVGSSKKIKKDFLEEGK